MPTEAAPAASAWAGKDRVQPRESADAARDALPGTVAEDDALRHDDEHHPGDARQTVDHEAGQAKAADPHPAQEAQQAPGTACRAGAKDQQ